MAKRKSKASQGGRSTKRGDKKRGPSAQSKKKPGQGNRVPKKNAAGGRKKKPAAKDDGLQRLQRVMASAGVASRRECELIIQEGRVEVDGNIIVELGYKVDPQKQEIYVDAEKIVVEQLQYFMLNKPAGIVSTSNDPSGRPRVIDLIDTNKRVYNVGRLDQSSEGLILVTNDGQLAHRLTHPRYGIEKKYHVQVEGRPTQEALRQLQDGIYIAEAKVRVSHIKYLKKAKTGSWLEIILTEGRNREIRRMLAAIGHKVRILKRVSIGPLKLDDLPKGAHRPLTFQELKSLQKATAGEAKPKVRPKRKRGKAISSKELREALEANKAPAKAKKPSRSGRSKTSGKQAGKKVAPGGRGRAVMPKRKKKKR